jgi:hypothetical protein
MWFGPFKHYLPVISILNLCPHEVLFFNYCYKNLTTVNAKTKERQEIKKATGSPPLSRSKNQSALTGNTSSQPTSTITLQILVQLLLLYYHP